GLIDPPTVPQRGSTTAKPGAPAMKPSIILIAFLGLPAAAVLAQEPPARMTVTGRVLDPAGKPVPGAMVAVYAHSLAPAHNRPLTIRAQLPIGYARADGSGRFHIDAPRTTSSRYERPGVVALAPGHGADWVELDTDADQPTAEITLRPERIIHGR